MFVTGILFLVMVFWLSPGIFALNRGRVLQNIALWLAIFAALGLFYKHFGPGSPHPLFDLPASMSWMEKAPRKDAPPPPPEKKENPDEEANVSGGGEKRLRSL
jgi:hypothetical protein